MARIRSIKPEFFRHHALFLCERETGLPIRLAFAGLWTAADREGRFRWCPEELKLDCLPYDDVDFSRVLDALATRGWVVRYASQGKDFGCIPTFKAHQIVNGRERDSVLPDPDKSQIVSDASSTRAPRVPHATHGEGKGREQEKEGEQDPLLSANATRRENPASAAPSAAGAPSLIAKGGKKLNGVQYGRFMRFWEAFGKKRGRAEAAAQWLKLAPDEQTTRWIVAAAQREALERPELIADGGTPKWAEGWLSGRRWEDRPDLKPAEVEDDIPF